MLTRQQGPVSIIFARQTKGLGGTSERDEGILAEITQDIPSGTFVPGSPAYPYDKATEIFTHTAHRPELKTKIAAMEERLAKLEQKLK